MTGRSLLRLGAVAAGAGGIFLGLDVVFHLFVDDTLSPAELGGLPHELWHVPGVLALPLILMGLIAIYLKQSEKSGRTGLWGFVLLVVGITVGAMYSAVFHALFVPAIENIEAGLFETLVDNTTAAQFYRGVVVQGLGLGLGAVLFGIATIRSGVFPKGTGWLFIAAAVFAAANELWTGGQLISRVLFAAAFAWMGAEVLRTAPAAPRPGH